ncbi:hypothetical protein BDC45DRAFT_58916 [Circinella umbellata]|nr:hypothetical protein BDC45DRAFT_58916 [Circinella umbellata]
MVRGRSHMATLGQDNNTVYVWGGYRDQSTGLPTGSGYQIPMEMYMYDIKNSQWSSGIPASSLDQIRMSHEAVRIGSNIYYIGGTYAETISSYREAPMNSIIIYDTDKSQWSTQTTNGPVPTTRIRHSATLIPSTGQIVLFGGQSPFNNTIFREDYFFILDTKNSMTWSTRGIGEEGPSFNGTGIYGHSAVLVENNLFILFGRSNDGNLGITANNILVMDVNKWSWISSISAVAPVDRSINGLSPDSPPDSNNSSDNKGAIAGAVVGALAGVSIIAGAIFFFIRRKRNQPSNNEQNEYVSHNNNIPSSSSEEPPPLHYYNTDVDNNNNVHQPMLAPSDVPHSVDESVSSGRGYVRSPISTDNTSSWQDRSAYYGSEKPDGSVSPGSFDEHSEPIRLTLKPVKPDGA